MAEETKICEYDPKILHAPVNPEGSVAEVISLLHWNLKLILKDERTFTGELIAFDKFGNFVLSNVKEYFRDQKREMKMVVIPLENVVSVFKSPPIEKEEETAPAAKNETESKQPEVKEGESN